MNTLRMEDEEGPHCCGKLTKLWDRASWVHATFLRMPGDCVKLLQVAGSLWIVERAQISIVYHIANFGKKQTQRDYSIFTNQTIFIPQVEQ